MQVLLPCGFVSVIALLSSITYGVMTIMRATQIAISLQVGA